MRFERGTNRKMEKSKEEELVINNIIEFLDSDKKRLMECCYSSIKDNQNGRYFKDKISVIEDNEFDSFFPLVSVVIMTANKIERDSLNYIAYGQKDNDLKKRKHAIPIFEGSDFGAPDAYLFKMQSVYVLHLHAYETGANTPGGSTDIVRFISGNLFVNPLCIISFGICYGRDPINQHIGDVLIPKKLYPWSIGQKIGDNDFEIKNDNFNLWLETEFKSSGIYSILRDFCNDDDGRIITDSIKLKGGGSNDEKQYDFSIKVTWGNMSTGEAVVSSQKAKKAIQDATKNEKEFGGEMEGYGIAKECIYYAKIPCFIIKSICDWGVCKDIDNKLKEKTIECPDNLKDKLQTYAAFCSAIALFQLLNYEKRKFLSLKIIEWLCENKYVAEYEYVEEDDIKSDIIKFYHTDSKSANKIFKILCKNNFLKKSNSGYLINENL